MSRLASPHLRDKSRAREKTWFTREQLYALGAFVLCSIVVAFFIGLRVGRSAPAPEAGSAVRLLPDAESADDLEVLLAEVELASAPVGPDGRPAAPTDDFSFPRVLGSDTTVPISEGADDGDLASTTIRPPVVGQPVPGGADGAPAGGWAVQVGTWPTPGEAAEVVARLKEAGFAAYRVAALVDGATWYRVRVGGFDSPQDADAARQEVQAVAGIAPTLVARAP